MSPRIPVPRILMCLETLIDFVLGPGWNNDDENLDQRREEINTLRSLIESDQLLLYVPPILVSAIHMTVQLQYGAQQAYQVVRDILRLGNSQLNIDYERVLEQTNALLLSCWAELDFYEVALLTCASTLRADAVVVRRPQHLVRCFESGYSEFPSFDVPIVSPNGLIGLLNQRGFHQFPSDGDIFVVTPEQRVIQLPYGSTPIDFAYKIHSHLGNRCERAFVDGAEVPLDTLLRTGNVIQIEKGNRSSPDRAWLDFVRTKTAKQGIRRGLNRYWCDRGWEIVKEELGRHVRTYRQKLEYVAEKHGKTTNELMAKVGSGKLSIRKLRELVDECTSEQVGEHALRADNQHDANFSSYTWRLSSCCNPLPGDSIMGIAGVNDRVIRVHQSDCESLQKVKPEKLHSVSWICSTCRIQLSLVMSDQPDVLRPILNQLVEDYDIQPDLRSVHIARDQTVWVGLGITVRSRVHLDEIVTKIEDAPPVLKTRVAKLTPILSEKASLTTTESARSP